MHEGVGGRWGPGGGVEGGPVPRTSLAHSGGRRWEGGRPGPCPCPRPLFAEQWLRCSGGGALARAPPGAGRRGAGAGCAARPTLSGSRPRGGASSARATLLLHARRSVRSPSGHCYKAAGRRSTSGLLRGLALQKSLSEHLAAASPQASGSERVLGREVGELLRTPSDPARASRSPCKLR